MTDDLENQSELASPDADSFPPRRRFGRRVIGRQLAALAGLIASATAAQPEPVSARKKKKKCAAGLVLCGGKCVSTATDNRNCGKCGTICKDDLRCASGKCVCPTTGTSRCGTRCYNLLTNNANCGSCGNACTGDLACAAGACSCPVLAQSKCGDKCFNLQTNDSHCGNCTTACTGELTCVSGTCGCADPAKSICNGDKCFNLQTNSNHCGNCATVCAGDLTCVSGTCGCTGGKSACGTKCYDLQTDQAHCGDCDTVCDPDVSDTCSGGSCNCGSGAACSGTGVYCVSGQCVDLNVCAACDFTTVQAAIDAAPAGATIPIAAGTYEGLITVNKNLTLSGAGKANTTLTWTDGSYPGPSVYGPIVTVQAGAAVRIEDLKITGGKHTTGYQYGGGVWNQGDLTLDGCDVSSNEAGTWGGGIYSEATAMLTLVDTDVMSNTSPGLYGGGIYSVGAVTITNGVISGNTATGTSGIGGGIACLGNLTATGTTIRNNSAVLMGGGCYLDGAGTTWTFTNCDIDSNTAPQAAGVLCFEGSLELKGTTAIRRNTATMQAGGLLLEHGSQAVLSDTSAIKDNTVTTSSGAGGGVVVGRGTANGYGFSSLTLNDSSAISGNTLTCSDNNNSGGGGVYVDGANDSAQVGKMTMTGTSSVVNNTASNSPGGGIRSVGKVALGPNCLVSGNTAKSGGGISSGGPYAPNDRLTGVTGTNVTGNTPDNVVNV